MCSLQCLVRMFCRSLIGQFALYCQLALIISLSFCPFVMMMCLLVRVGFWSRSLLCLVPSMTLYTVAFFPSIEYSCAQCVHDYNCLDGLFSLLVWNNLIFLLRLVLVWNNLINYQTRDACLFLARTIIMFCQNIISHSFTLRYYLSLIVNCVSWRQQIKGHPPLLIWSVSLHLNIGKLRPLVFNIITKIFVLVCIIL